MAPPKKRSFERDVFINCPFDDRYRPIFDAIVYTVVRSGFRPRSALETDDAAEVRITKIAKIIGECPFGIHDISRTEQNGKPPLPRFNMPLELGLFLGAKAYGNRAVKKKQALILDSQPFRYQRFISDIAGQDIKAHGGKIDASVDIVSAWLRNHSGFAGVPGSAVVKSEYKRFQKALPVLCRSKQLAVEELNFNDRVQIITGYVTPPVD